MHVFQSHQTEPYLDTLCAYLRLSQVNYHMIDLLDNQLVLEKMAPHSALLRSVLLQDDQGLLLAIMPQAGLLDLNLIEQCTQRSFECAPRSVMAALPVALPEQGCPPLSEYVGLSAVIDLQILMMETVYFRIGDANVLIGLHRDEFLKLQKNMHFGAICIPMEILLEDESFDYHHHEGKHSFITQLTPMRMKQRTQQLLNLPILPNVMQQLLQVHMGKAHHWNYIESIIETDPSLSLQVLSWVQSPQTSPRSSINTVEAAIEKRLGVDLTLNLSLMTALSAPMKMPKKGRLGWQSYWRAALHAGMLSQILARIIEPGLAEKQKIAYFSGLFHNIGLLILSELFPSYYQLLNQLMLMNNHLSISMVEQYAFGLTHHQLASWLMEAWVLPKEIIASTHWYENDVTQLQGQEAKIVRLAMHLLAEQHIGEGPLIIPEKALCEALGLTQEQAQEALLQSLAEENRIRRLIQ